MSRFGSSDFGGGFRRFRESRAPKPVKEGEEMDVEIKEVGTKGDGIARIENFVIFVPNTEKGEKCKIRIKMVRPKFAVAEKIGKNESKEEDEKETEKTKKSEKKEKGEKVDEDK